MATPARTALSIRVSPHARFGHSVLARADLEETTRNPLGSARFLSRSEAESDELRRWLKRLAFGIALLQVLTRVAAPVHAENAAPPGKVAPAADALAERFAVDSDPEPRLGFVPNHGRYLGQQHIPPANAPIEPTTGSNPQPPLVTIKDLPRTATLSSGRRVSPTDWVLSRDDLSGLVVTLPPAKGPPVRTKIAVAASGAQGEKAIAIEIRRAAIPGPTRGRPVKPLQAPVTALPQSQTPPPKFPLPIPLPLPPFAAAATTGSIPAPPPAQPTKVQPLFMKADPTQVTPGPTAGTQTMLNLDFRLR